MEETSATQWLPSLQIEDFSVNQVLPSEPSSVTVIKDCAGRYFLSFVVEVEPINTFASIAITRAFFACDRPWPPAIYRG
jgi:hypothetical protein